jgi:hypothetical protein
MKRLLFLLLAGLSLFVNAQSVNEFPLLKGEYLGQKTPDTIPEIFAKDIVSDSTWYEHCQLAISPKGDEIYWSAFSKKYPLPNGKGNTEQIYYSKIEDGKWTKPALAEFVTDYLTYGNGSPVFSPDGSGMYFNSTRPDGLGGADVWYVERANEKWNTPVNIGAPVNNEKANWSPSFSNNETAFLVETDQNNPNARPVRFVYRNNMFMDSSTVKIHPDFYPYYSITVSPDEDFMIFSGYHYLGVGVLDLYVCYKDEQDNWGYPIMMRDKITTESIERFPVVSPDGKFLFFVRQEDTHNFYWVSTRILDKYRSESLEKMKSTPRFIDTQLEAEEINEYLGVYSPLDKPFKFTISSEEGKLKIKMGSSTYPLECYGKNKFKYDKRMIKIEFFPDENRMFFQSGIEKIDFVKE